MIYRCNIDSDIYRVEDSTFLASHRRPCGVDQFRNNKQRNVVDDDKTSCKLNTKGRKIPKSILHNCWTCGRVALNQQIQSSMFQLNGIRLILEIPSFNIRKKKILIKTEGGEKVWAVWACVCMVPLTSVWSPWSAFCFPNLIAGLSCSHSDRLLKYTPSPPWRYVIELGSVFGTLVV